MPGTDEQARLEILRRDFLSGAGALFLSACGVMSQVRVSDAALGKPHPDAYTPVLDKLISTVMPFEHAAFPKLSAASLRAELLRLFPLGSDARYEHVPTALVIFDDVAAFDPPLAPFVADERVDLALSRIDGDEARRQLDEALTYDQASFTQFRAQYGNARFTQQSLEGRRAYLALWSQSRLIARRRVYRGFKSMVMISAYSQAPFWDVVGYEGPLLPKGG